MVPVVARHPRGARGDARAAARARAPRATRDRGPRHRHRRRARRRGEGLPRRRPGGARAAARRPSGPDIGADALATDLKLRDESDRVRMQPAADAEEIDTTDLEVDDVVARIEELVRVAHARLSRGATATSPGGPRGCWIAPLGARSHARPRLRARPDPAERRLRARDQPPVVDRHPARRRALAAEHQLRREGRGARGVPGFGRFIRWHGTHRGPARRVRPRRGAADARRRRTTAARSALFVEGTRQTQRRPGRGAAGRGDGRDPGGRARRPDRRLRHAVLEAVGNFAPCSIAVGEPFLLEGAAEGRPRLHGGERSRSSGGSASSSTGSPTSTRAAGRRGGAAAVTDGRGPSS